ncbi:MAG: hypothetical protein ACXWLR_08925 [Myxococcales bacterium]
MRLLPLFALCLALVACKKSPQPTVPRIPDSNIGQGGGTFESEEAVMFHTVYRYSGHTGQALAFYGPEMEKRGAQRVGDSYVDDNVVHRGGFGMQGTASPNDPTKPGVFLYVMETPDATLIDVWENVPKAR